MRQMLNLFLPLVAALALSAAASAQTFPLSVQGKLTGVPDGQQSMTLKIWDAASGGNEVASLLFTTQVVSSVFSATIDAPLDLIATPGVAYSGETRWWSVVANGSETGRQLMSVVPYAASVRGIFVTPDGRVGIGSEAPLYKLVVAGGVASEAVITTDVFVSGRIGIGTQTPQELLHVEGRAKVDNLTVDREAACSVLRITGGSDLAEPFTASSYGAIEPEPGKVMSIDPENPGALRVCTSSYDTTVAGVFSGGNGLNTGMIMGQEGCELTASGEGKVPLAMTGRVWVYADDSNGAIKPGDRLTTSGTKPGHAMKVMDETRSIGAVIGKAMTKVDPDSGMVMVLVNLQ